MTKPAHCLTLSRGGQGWERLWVAKGKQTKLYLRINTKVAKTFTYDRECYQRELARKETYTRWTRVPDTRKQHAIGEPQWKCRIRKKWRMVGRRAEGLAVYLNKRSLNLNREIWAKFNIISKEINTPPRIRRLRKLFMFTFKETPLSYFKQYTTSVLPLRYIIFEQSQLALMSRTTEVAGPSVAIEGE